MKTVFVDTNVFLRFFTRDDEGQHARAVALLRKGTQGEIVLVTGPPVLFEICWTLRSAYKQPKNVVLDVLSRMRALPGLQMTDAVTVDAAVALAAESGREFADAYIVASSSAIGADGIATFNRKDFRTLGAGLYDL